MSEVRGVINWKSGGTSQQLPVQCHWSLPYFSRLLLLQIRTETEIRAETNLARFGLWSDPTMTEVTVPPPIPPSTIVNITVINSTADNTGELLNISSLIISVQWSPPDELNGNLSSYELWVGLMELQPEEIVPSSEITQFPPGVTEGNVTVEFPRPCGTELVVFLHVS